MTFDPLFVPEEVLEAVSDEAWLAGMLEAERALANAEALAGVIPPEAAAAIADACRPERFDVRALAEAGRGVGNPAEPLVRALREEAGAEAGQWVHWGATSQDILDSAAMLVSRRALDLILAELDGVAAGCARLAEEHRLTPMAARTLLQQAVPTTFGFKAAGWLVGALDARHGLTSAREDLAAELGGAAGTLAALGPKGLEVASLFARELDLPEPALPWHSNRMRVARLGAALAAAAGALAKIGVDVALLAQTEVGEVAEAGAGGSSTMPQKRNPVGSALAIACARRVRAAASVLTESLVAEHERGIGGWQAEWGALSEALAYTGGAAAAAFRTVVALEVDPERMRGNLEATGGLVVSERLAFLLAGTLGRAEAHRVLAEAAASGLPLREALAGHLPPDRLDEAFDPTTYLGSAAAFVDRALDRYRQERG